MLQGLSLFSALRSSQERQFILSKLQKIRNTLISSKNLVAPHHDDWSQQWKPINRNRSVKRWSRMRSPNQMMTLTSFKPKERYNVTVAVCGSVFDLVHGNNKAFYTPLLVFLEPKRGKLSLRLSKKMVLRKIDLRYVSKLIGSVVQRCILSRSEFESKRLHRSKHDMCTMWYHRERENNGTPKYRGIQRLYPQRNKRCEVCIYDNPHL